jgi:hypothetical protein
MGGMLDQHALRTLGEEGVAALLRRRPDLLNPPPASLTELAERLTDPHSLSLALSAFDTPTIQVAEALAAIGSGADRAQVERLLGVVHGPAGDTARSGLDRSLAVLREHLFLPPSTGRVTLLAEIVRAWPEPLGLGPSAEELVRQQTAEAIRHALRVLGVETRKTLKADLVAVLVATLTDPDRVRAIIDGAPAHVAATLCDAAAGRALLTLYSYYSYRFSGGRGRAPVDPAQWAAERMLVFSGYDGSAVMPAEVAMALRGVAWTAPFDPDPPSVTWTPRPVELVEREMAAAAAGAVRLVTSVLESAGTSPVPLLKNGAVGVRELRRMAKATGVPTADIRLGLALAHMAGLLGTSDAGAMPTPDADAWLALRPADRLAALVTAWLDLPALPVLDEGTAWRPDVESGVATAKRVVLDALAAHSPAAAPPAELAAWVAWQRPLPLGGSLSSGLLRPEQDERHSDLGDEVFPGEHEVDDERTPGPLDIARRLVPAVLAEAAWLGLVGAGALTSAGRAAHEGSDLAAAVGDALGSARDTARIQADLTAVVLGHPSADLAATLDGLAEREGTSTAAMWRFSPTSIRRAMDAGLSARQILDDLAGIAEGGVPQPLEYLIGDVARRHGLLRAGAVQCYLRSDDEALLREVAADRRFRTLGLRPVGTGVLVGQRPLDQTLAALRAGGYSPVEEGPDGVPVLARRERHRTQRPRTAGRAPRRNPACTAMPITPEAVAADLVRRRPPEPKWPPGSRPARARDILPGL